jgi:hypothetical protein
MMLMHRAPPPLLPLLLLLLPSCTGGQQQQNYYGYTGMVTVTYTSFSPLSSTMLISSAPTFQENLARAIQQSSNQTLELLLQNNNNSSSSSSSSLLPSTNGLSAQACGGASLSYADPASGVCRLCTICVGRYQVGQCLFSDSVCVDQCPAGTYAHSGGAIGGSEALGSCSPCLPGTFSSSAGVSACSICPNQTYASTHGATTCTACAAGTITLAVGAIVCVPAVRRRDPTLPIHQPHANLTEYHCSRRLYLMPAPAYPFDKRGEGHPFPSS